MAYNHVTETLVINKTLHPNPNLIIALTLTPSPTSKCVHIVTLQYWAHFWAQISIPSKKNYSIKKANTSTCNPFHWDMQASISFRSPVNEVFPYNFGFFSRILHWLFLHNVLVRDFSRHKVARHRKVCYNLHKAIFQFPILKRKNWKSF